MYKRIVSLAPSNTEILFELGVQDNIVGVTSLCSYPEQAKELPKVGSWIHVKDMDKVEKLKPDLILTSMYVPPTVKEWAEKKRVKLINIFPRTLEDIFDSVMMIGVLTGKGIRAQEIISDMKIEIENLETNPKNVKIYSEEYHKPPTVAGNWVPQLIRIAGGIPMIEPGKLSPEVNLEQVENFNPDAIVLHWCGFGIKSNKRDLVKRGWGKLRAVKEDKVFIVDDDFLNRPGPRIWKGIEALKRIIGKI